MTDELKKTPLYDYNVSQDLKLIDFGGWALPVKYTNIQEEHHAVREKVGMFDVSHMGEIFITGEKATEWINGLITNDLTKMSVNQCQYTALTYEDGGMIDDLIFFKFAEDKYYVTPNASNKDKVLKWLKDHNDGSVEIDDQSDDTGLIALQGPDAEAVLSKVTDTDLSEIKFYRFKPAVQVGEVETILVSRTGYTGEDGFEIYVPGEKLEDVWKLLLEAGEAFGLQECGLGARDTLRLEAGLPLYGHEFNEEVDPLTGGIGFFVKLNKEQAFIGQEALKEINGEEKSERVSRGFDVTGKGIVREGAKVLLDGEEIGEVTSGTKSPTLDKAIGMAIVDRKKAPIGTEVEFEVRRRTIPGIITKKDWLKR